jgi:hypothetical protein
MKKLAIGCGIVLVLCGIAFCVMAYVVYYKAQSYMAPVRQLAQIGQMDSRVANHTPYTAPAGGELTEDQMRRFAAVHESMKATLGKRVDELTAKQNEWQRRQQSEHRDATPGEVYAAVTDMMGLVLEAKSAQVTALNASHFSIEEYDWVRSHVYAAAGLSLAQISLANLPDAIKNGGDITRTMPSADDVPERNKAIVAPYMPKLREWAPFIFFGL